jgi:DNA-binding NtrC family response regulator
MLTASDEIQMAITLLKKGAADYILKDDACFDNLKKTLNNILNIRNYESEIRFYKNKADTYRKRLIYASVAMAVIILALFLLFY